MAEPVIKIMIEEHIRSWHTVNKEDFDEGGYVDENGDLSDDLRVDIDAECIASWSKAHDHSATIHILKEFPWQRRREEVYPKEDLQ